MDFCTKVCDDSARDKPISGELVKECLTEYKLQDKVEALKNHFGICDSFVPPRKKVSWRREKKIAEPTTVKDCLRPPVPSTFQSLVHDDLRNTIRNSYWNKEIGRTIYLPPHLPAGCEPVTTTFGKIMTPDEYGVRELINPRCSSIDDPDIHKLYRKTHNDYYPSEQIDRKYVPPFDKCSSFGDAKKTANLTGKKMADCMRWFSADSVTLVIRELADFSYRNQLRLGKVKNYENVLSDLRLERSAEHQVEGVADVLKEAIDSDYDVYCSDYAEKYSKTCESSKAESNRTTGLPGERTDVSYFVSADGAAKSDIENLGDQTSVMALISPSTFTQFGLSHIDFFKVRGQEEIRSIFENTGVTFPGNSFDDLWNEGLRKDGTGGVCVETFRNLLAKLPTNYVDNKVVSKCL